MNIELLVVNLRLHGCTSLKDKRQRLGGLKDRFGRLSNVSVCESDFQDMLGQAQWSFLAIALDGKIAGSILSKIEHYISTEVDAVITNIHRERL